MRLALYRVTQEALTNVRKHAHPDRVEVRLEYLPDEVSLVVQDCAVLARHAGSLAAIPGLRPAVTGSPG